MQATYYSEAGSETEIHQLFQVVMGCSLEALGTMAESGSPDATSNCHQVASIGFPLWGAGRIRDTLILLGFDTPCEDTIRKYMAKPRRPQDGVASWLAFLHNHVDVSWAMDFFTVATADFKYLYVFVVLHHGRRRVIHFAATFNPSMDWVLQQLREATPFGRQPKYMFRDNDNIYGHGVRAFLSSCGIEEVRTAYRSPWQKHLGW